MKYIDFLEVRKWINAGLSQTCGIGLFSSNHSVDLRSLVWRCYKKLNRYEIFIVRHLLSSFSCTEEFKMCLFSYEIKLGLKKFHSLRVKIQNASAVIFSQ